MKTAVLCTILVLYLASSAKAAGLTNQQIIQQQNNLAAQQMLNRTIENGRKQNEQMLQDSQRQLDAQMQRQRQLEAQRKRELNLGYQRPPKRTDSEMK